LETTDTGCEKVHLNDVNLEETDFSILMRLVRYFFGVIRGVSIRSSVADQKAASAS
jgi:hypothetical protein